MAEPMDLVLERLDRIESALTQLLGQKTAKEWYTTAELAAIVGKAEYTVREWCRQGRVQADKVLNGRGWRVSHDEVTRIRNHGPLPIPKHEPDRILNGRRK